MKNIDPTQYNLSSRVDLRQDRSGDLLIIIDRKSRIIMKDGIRVLEMVKKINKIENPVIEHSCKFTKDRLFNDKRNKVVRLLHFKS